MRVYIAVIFLLLAMPIFAQVDLQSYQNPNSITNTTVSDIEAAETEFSNAGLLPDNPFYFLKTIKEKIQLFLTFNKEGQAKLHLDYAKTRLAEAKKLIEKNKTEELNSTLEYFNSELANFESSTKGIGKNVSALVKESEDVLEKSRIVLELVREKVPDSARLAIEKAINNSIEKKVRIPFGLGNETTGNETKKLIIERIEQEIKRGEEIREKIQEKINQKIEERNDRIKKEKPQFCIQVITPAFDPETGECKEFPTPCDVPEGWEKIGSCRISSNQTIDKPEIVRSTLK